MATPDSICWLHLTDLHFGQGGQRWLWPDVRDEFEKDLAELIEKTGPFELVLFTGDLTQKGTPGEFAALTEELESLWTLFDQLGCAPALVPVPGNHDLTWPLPIPPVVRALRAWNDDEDLRWEFWDAPDGPYRTVIDEVFAAYRGWLADWRIRHPLPDHMIWREGTLPGDFGLTVHKPDLTLGVVGLNSAFLQLTEGDYMGRLDVDVRQLHGVCDGAPGRWVGRHHAALLMTHHPPEWLHPRPLAAWKAQVATPGRFAAHLYGHMHEPAARSMRIAGSAALRQIQGASAFGLERWGDGPDAVERIHGYSAGRLEGTGDRGCLRVWPRLMKLLSSSGSYRLVPDFDHFELDRNELDWRAEGVALNALAADANGVPAVATPEPRAPDGRLPQAPGASYDPIWYVERGDEERLARAALQSAGASVVVVGSDLSGKTQFMRHVVGVEREAHAASGRTLRLVSVDLGALDAETLADPERLFRAFTRALLAGVGHSEPSALDAAVEAIWRRPSTLRRRVGHAMAKHVFEPTADTVVLVIDNTDAMIGRPTEEAFFGMLRGWAESSSQPPWSSLRMLLALSTTRLFLRNSGLTSDFFNRVVFVRLSDFGPDQAAALAALYGLAWDAETVRGALELVGGHPFLLRMLMFHSALRRPDGPLFDLDELEESVYQEHLKQRWLWVQRDPALIDGLRHVLDTPEAPLNPDVYEGLKMAGLVVRRDGQLTMRNALYARWFRKCLGA